MKAKQLHVPRGKILKVTTNNQRELFNRKGKNNLAQLIDAESIEIVVLTKDISGQADLLLVVNDQGYESRLVQRGVNRFELLTTKALLPVNIFATELYHSICIPGTTHQIVGDVLILHDGDEI